MPYSFPHNRKVYWKPQELARALRCSATWVYRLAGERGMPVMRRFGYTWVPHVEARAWFRRHGMADYANLMELSQWRLRC